MSLVHRLAASGSAEALREHLRTLPDAKTAVNLVDDRGESPLYSAVTAPDPNAAVIEVLLEAGADVNFIHRYEPLPMPGADMDDTSWLQEMGIEAEGLSEMLNTFSQVLEFHTVHKAVQTGSLEIVRLFERYGADFRAIDEHGYTSVFHAVNAPGATPEYVQYFLNLGIDPSARTSYNEIPLVNALRQGTYGIVRCLVEAGAEEAVANWTPLLRAASLGGVEDVKRELACGADIGATDCVGYRAVQIAIRRGDHEMFEALLKAGASVAKVGDEGMSSLCCAVEAGNLGLIVKMLDLGCTVDETGLFGATPLSTAVENGRIDIVRLLIERGADVNKEGCGEPNLRAAKDRETILLLLDAGADPSEIDNDVRRKLAGMGPRDDSDLSKVTKEQYLAARYAREGSANPEEMTEPFKLAMIRAGCDAYWARKQFSDDPSFSCGRSWASRPPQVWCFQRFGQSITLLPDGRSILIAGEHEDSYDPDFCIYNDVTVFHPGGRIQILGYPYKTFEPTDFHSATLVESDIWIVGGLGYPGQRKGAVPVYRLSTRDFSITKLSTEGDVPPRIYSHRARVRDGYLEIGGGTAITFKGEDEDHSPNENIYRLDLSELVWSKVPSPSQE